MMCGMLEGVAHWRRGDASFHDFTELIKGLLVVPSIAQGLNHLVNERKVKNVNQVINAALGNVTALARCLSQGCVCRFGVFYFGSRPLEVCEMAFVVRGVGRLLLRLPCCWREWAWLWVPRDFEGAWPCLYFVFAQFSTINWATIIFLINGKGKASASLQQQKKYPLDKLKMAGSPKY